MKQLAVGDVLVHKYKNFIIVVAGINHDGICAFTNYVAERNSLVVLDCTWKVKSLLENWTKVEI